MSQNGYLFLKRESKESLASQEEYWLAKTMEMRMLQNADMCEDLTTFLALWCCCESMRHWNVLVLMLRKQGLSRWVRQIDGRVTQTD